MWYLTSDADQRIIYVVPQSNQITIGRSTDDQICNFAILEDPSISRKHATLTLSDNCLYLQDLGSRYGTFVNDSMDKMEINTKITLQHNDIVKFGKMNSIWNVHKINFVTCTSTLKGENLQNLKLVLSKIGGTLINDWDDSCRYVTMPAITLTIKVVLALVEGSYIVTTDFWLECMKSINNRVQLPDPKNFTPQIIESTLNKELVSFLPNLQRKLLFVGKKIIFFSRRQFEMYKTVLLNSSASPLLLSESKMTKSMLCEKDVIVIQYNLSNTSQETQAQRNQINDIVTYLKSKGKRIVADAEIGLAILYCSLDKYCNPDFNYSSELLKQTSISNTATNVLVPESQESSQLKRENVIINESLVANNNSSITSDNANMGIGNKRKINCETDDIQPNSSKKFATEVADTSDKNNKRKFDDADESLTNPMKKVAVANDDDDFFNFMSSSNVNNNKQTEKKLNLLKPQKRKAELSTNDDDLFNFIETNEKQKKAALENLKPNTGNHVNTANNNMGNIKPQDIIAKRGAKLEELMKENMTMNSDAIKVCVKQEPNMGIDEKMKELDLGCTIVKVNKDLIIKKEPLQVEEQNVQAKNFKKFKKVWPVKMQVTIIQRSSLSIAIAGTDDVSSTNIME